MADNSSFQIDLSALDRYLAGTSTQDEYAVISDMLQRDGDLQRMVEVLRAAGQDFSNVRSEDKDVEHAWQRDWQKINASFASKTAFGRVRRSLTWPLGVILAAVAAFLVMRPHTRPAKTPPRVYATGATQEGVVMLPDSTRVTLAPRTTMRVAQFDTRGRSVTIEGQAYFEVARSSHEPFVVRSGAFTTRVLGTEFMVKHLSGRSDMLVSVAEGKVRVTSDAAQSRGTTLTAGAIGDLHDTTVIVKTVDGLAPGTELLQGKLVFHHTPVSTVLQTLSRWYGFQFLCTDPALAQQYVTVGVSMRSSSAALAALKTILDVTFNVTGDTITLTPQSMRPVRATPRVRAYDAWTSTGEAGR